MKLSRFGTKPERRLIAFVPELEALLREAERPPPLIGRLTAGSQSRPLPAACPQVMLAIGEALPAAPLTRRIDRPDNAEGVWLRADPIGLVPDLAAVWLQADRQFDDGPWREALDELLAEEGLSLDLHPSGRGYVQLSETPDCRFAPPRDLAGNSLEYCLPEGPDAGRWRRLLNETQVLLHQYSRGGSESSLPGSLWFWGGGELPGRCGIRPRVKRVVSSDPLLIGLADWLGLPCETDLEPASLRPGSLIEFPVSFEETADSNLQRIEGLVREIWRNLRMGRIGEFELAGAQSAWRFGPLDAWRVWR